MADVPRSLVKSSSLASVGHDPATNELHVEFRNGSVYVFSDVTAEHHAALVSAESLGKHFATEIRGKFAHRKLETTDEAEQQTAV